MVKTRDLLERTDLGEMLEEPRIPHSIRSLAGGFRMVDDEDPAGEPDLNRNEYYNKWRNTPRLFSQTKSYKN